MAENKFLAGVDWTPVRFSIKHKPNSHDPMGEVYFNLVLCFLNADKQIRLVQKPTIVQDRYLGHVLGIKAGFHPIFACLNLIRRIHFQLINRSTPCRRCTQQLEPSSVEIKMLIPRVLARVE